VNELENESGNNVKVKFGDTRQRCKSCTQTFNIDDVEKTARTDYLQHSSQPMPGIIRCKALYLANARILAIQMLQLMLRVLPRIQRSSCSFCAAAAAAAAGMHTPASVTRSPSLFLAQQLPLASSGVSKGATEGSPPIHNTANLMFPKHLRTFWSILCIITITNTVRVI